MSYVPLWCKSNYSFLEGASHPEELIRAAAELGIPALALTDRNGLYGVVRAHGEAKRCGIRLIVGAQITMDAGEEIILLAADREGYANLSGLISTGRLRSEKGNSRVTIREVCDSAGGLVAVLPSPVAMDGLVDAFYGRLYVGIARHRRTGDMRLETIQRDLAQRYKLPPVAFSEVLYHDPSRRRLQDVVTSIRHNVPLNRAGTLLRSNGEYYVRPPGEMEELYRDDPALLETTATIARQCTFSLAELEYRYPSEPLPSGMSSARYLRELTFRGAGRRYPGHEGVPDSVVGQIEKELELIEELEYCGYFLTMYEIVAFCRREGILCQGRGSAANSAVCYCLGITAVDPVRMNLLFERFLSRERAEPPDIDLDIEHRRREEVIRYMYARYGRDRAAMVANIVRYRIKSAIRDVGKALDLSRTALDTAAKLASRDGNPARAFTDAGLDPNAAGGNVLDLVLEIIDFPRHLSIHPGGFLLGSEPVSRIVPVENATMPGRTVIQWDKYDVEEMNLFKVDLLGLGALTHLDYCFRMLAEEGISLSIATIPSEDTATYRLLTRGDTIGVFQLESRAQMAMLPRLKPRTFYDLVIEVSIIRPGPITGGMVHPFLRRRFGEEEIEYPHPDLETVLGKTLGVPLFQEQVMRVAIIAADYTPGEADQLRRDMAAWRRSGRIEKHRERIIRRMMAKGIEKEFAERVFDQIRGFGEYGFPESHAASFALIAYATAWMRTHHPAVFTCGLLNAWPMGFYAPAAIVDDAKRRGITVLPIEINASAWECTLEDPTEEREIVELGGGKMRAVRMGLRYVKGLGENDGKRILAARVSGIYRSVREVARRTGLNEGALQALARAGTFDTFGTGRREALWETLGAKRGGDRKDGETGYPEHADYPEHVHATQEGQTLPLDAEEVAPPLSPLSRFDTILWDYRATVHSTRGHPLEPLREEISGWGFPDAQGVSALTDGSAVRYAGLVICRQRPGTAGGTVFLTLEDEAGLVNLIVWKRVYQQYRTVILMSPCLGVTGTIQSKEGVVHVVVDSCFTPRFTRVPADPGSRDFY